MTKREKRLRYLLDWQKRHRAFASVQSHVRRIERNWKWLSERQRRAILLKMHDLERGECGDCLVSRSTPGT